MSANSLIKNIDQFLFDRVSAIKAFTPYQAFQEFLSGLDDGIRDIVKYIISTILIMIPIVFVFSFWMQNRAIYNQVELNKTIYRQASKIIVEDQQFGQAGKNLISSNAPPTESALSSRIKTLLAGSRIETDKVRIQNFASESFSEKIQQNSVDLVFNDFTTTQLAKFVSELSYKYKAKVNNIEVVKNNTKKFIDGKVSILYLSTPKS